MTGSERFGANLRDWRQKRRLTQEQLGEKVGADGPRVGRLEKGTENPTLESIDRLAAALDVDVSVLHAPRPEEQSERAGELGGSARGGTWMGVDPVYRAIIEQLDAETPAPDTIEGDILKASAALDRALRRLAAARAAGE
jgi:transcriptional regulator with XRE-family HTH domain